MYASVIELQFQPGKTEEALEMTQGLIPELRQIDGLMQFLVVDRGNDRSLVIAVYESQAKREAATSSAQAILGRMAGLLAAAPNREGCEVSVNELF